MAVRLILVVDNSARLGHVVKEFVDDDSKTIVTRVQSGKEALRFVESIHPSLILLNASLPDMDGLSLCPLLRERLGPRAVPIIAFAADGARGIVTSAGCDRYLKRPIVREDLLDALQPWL